MPFKISRAITVLATLLIISVHALATFEQCRLLPTGTGPSAPPGQIYLNLRSFFRPGDEAGYLTDRDLSPESNETSQFLKAQYALAPVPLRPGESTRPWVILDYKDPTKATAVIAELRAEVIYESPEGVILLKRRRP